MNWNHFILLLTGIYLGYYAVNILADLYQNKKSKSDVTDQDVLFFSEDSQPELIVYDDEPEKVANTIAESGQKSQYQETGAAYPAPVMESTGAISIKDLIKVAQAGVLQYTKAIPY